MTIVTARAVQRTAHGDRSAIRMLEDAERYVTRPGHIEVDVPDQGSVRVRPNRPARSRSWRTWALILLVPTLGGCALTVRGHEGGDRAALSEGDHTVLIGGVELAYHVHGRGPVVIAHPGGPGMWWDILRMPEVEKVATVVYLEPVGTGGSQSLADPKGYTMERYISDLEGLRAHLGLDHVVLLGHSHGGMVAQAYALAHEDHLRGLILYDTSPTTGREWQQDVAANLEWFKSEAWYADAVAALGQETTATTDAQMTAIFKREMPLYFAEWTKRAVEYEPYRQRVRLSVAPSRSVTDTASPDAVGVAPAIEVRDQLPSLRVPTLIFAGSKDFVCSEKMARILHGRIRGSRLVVLAHSGHMGHIEEPRVFAAAIGTFLSELTHVAHDARKGRS